MTVLLAACVCPNAFVGMVLSGSGCDIPLDGACSPEPPMPNTDGSFDNLVCM